MAKITAIFKKPLDFWQNSGKKRRAAIIIGAALVVVIGARALAGGGSPQPQAAEYIFQSAEKHDIVSTLEGTGTVQPLDSYTVIATVNGEVLSAPFEEGDIIEKGALLYQIDTTKAQNNYTQSQLNLQTAADELAKLSVTAPQSGQIISIDCEQGDDVTPGQTLITLEDRNTLLLKLPFLSSETSAIAPGQTANITMTATGEQLSGTVKEVAAVQNVGAGGALTNEVTISVQNPGGLTEGLSASATIGSIACAGNGTFSYQASEQITAEVAGTVASLAVKEGDTVSRGQTLLKLSSNSVQNNYKNAQLNLQNAQQDLDNYTITSPIKGTVIEKNFKAGDTIDSSNAAAQMAVIFDLSQLEFTMNVDELDIANLAIGQKVVITADALADQTFEGYVSKISINGATNNGVTTYPITVTIDDAGDLLPGMNVNAVITLQEAKDVLAVPAAAVSRGNMVLVKGEPAEGEEADPTLPEGYVWREVTLGVNDKDYVEITGGLQEGDEIAIDAAAMNGDTDSMTSFGEPGGPGGPGGGREGF